MTPPSVSLIGSFRQHYADIREAARIFTAAGMTVKSPPISRIIDPEWDYVRFEADPPEATDLEIKRGPLRTSSPPTLCTPSIPAATSAR